MSLWCVLFSFLLFYGKCVRVLSFKQSPFWPNVINLSNVYIFYLLFGMISHKSDASRLELIFFFFFQNCPWKFLSLYSLSIWCSPPPFSHPLWMMSLINCCLISFPINFHNLYFTAEIIAALWMDATKWQD